MDMQDRIAQWADRMGYKGKINPEIKRACNARTEVIWNQILNIAKPKQEVEHVRKTLIMHHLNENKTNSKVTINFPLKELEVWKKKRDLEEKVEAIKGAIMRSEQKVDSMSKRNNELYIRNENVQQRIKEHERKEYLLYERLPNIGTEIMAVKEKLDYCVNLTPVEGSDNRSIIDDLNDAAEKLKTLVPSSKIENTSNNSSLNVPNTFKINHFLLNEAPIGVGVLEKEIDFIKDKGPMEDVQKILYKYDRSALWHNFRNIEEYLKKDYKTFIFNHTEIKSEDDVSSTGKDLMSRLHMLHIEIQLETFKCHYESKHYKKNIEDIEHRLLKKLSAENYTDDDFHKIKLYILNMKEEAGLNAAISTLKKEHKALNEKCGVNNELQLLNGKLYQIQSSLETGVQNLIHKKYQLMHTHRIINAIREETVFTIRSLNVFIEDFAWSTPLSHKLALNEIMVFKDVCLDYNMRFTFVCKGEEKYMRDYVTRTLPYTENMSEETVSMVASLIGNPSRTPESIILNILQNKTHLETLKSLSKIPAMTIHTKYCMEQLTKQESYLDYVIDKIMYLIRNGNPIRKMSKIREIMDLWQEMPMKEIILPTRLLNGEPYKYFEEMYDIYYKQL